MSNTYTFKISSTRGTSKAILQSLIVVALYVAIIFLVFSEGTLHNKRNYFFFVGGGLWFFAFVSAINRSGEWMECEIGAEGLRIRFKNSSQLPQSGREVLDWNQLESYSVTKHFSGTILLVKKKNAAIRKLISIPFYNNKLENIRQFIRDFEKYASLHNGRPIPVQQKSPQLISFHQTWLAKIIGYVIIAYLVFIFIIKLTGLDDGKIPWSNVFSTVFFATIYLTFVFWKRK